MQKIKSAALALPALLLAGCAAALPAENTATIETAAAAAPQTLKVYTSASLAPAAQAYAEAQGVALTLTDEAASADLLLTDHAPGGSLLDVTSDTLLAAAAARAGVQAHLHRVLRAARPVQHPLGERQDALIPVQQRKLGRCRHDS